QILAHLLEAGTKLPRPTRQAQKSKAAHPQQPLDLPRKIARHRHPSARRLREEPLGGSSRDYIAPGRQPQTAARQPFRRVEQKTAVGADNEAKQLALGPNLARGNTAAQRTAAFSPVRVLRARRLLNRDHRFSTAPMHTFAEVVKQASLP